VAGVGTAAGVGTLAGAATRWSSTATSIDGIERELARGWAEHLPATVMATVAGEGVVDEAAGAYERPMAARTSVMNLVVVAPRPEIAERCAATISQLTGRQPTRVVIVSSRDPDGPPWLKALVEARAVRPRADVPETWAEVVHVSAGGETGRHLQSIVGPLLVHDLPVTLWWPGEPPFGSDAANELLAMADRLVVDGSSWRGDGLGRLRAMAGLLDGPALSVSDFALVRQSRWREAIASVFDVPDILPYLRDVNRISVTFAAQNAVPGATNLVKPVYHLAWFASRLGMKIRRPLEPVTGDETRGYTGILGTPRGGETIVSLHPFASAMPSGTTLRIHLAAERRGSDLEADVTAESETVNVRVRLDGQPRLTRSFLAPRRTDPDLLGEAIETGGRDVAGAASIRFAARLVGEA
jgi:hypothetical protein